MELVSRDGQTKFHKQVCSSISFVSGSHEHICCRYFQLQTKLYDSLSANFLIFPNAQLFYCPQLKMAFILWCNSPDCSIFNKLRRNMLDKTVAEPIQVNVQTTKQNK